MSGWGRHGRYLSRKILLKKYLSTTNNANSPQKHISLPTLLLVSDLFSHYYGLLYIRSFIIIIPSIKSCVSVACFAPAQMEAQAMMMRKRLKIAIACHACRSRKVKCNGARPGKSSPKLVPILTKAEPAFKSVMSA